MKRLAAAVLALTALAWPATAAATTTPTPQPSASTDQVSTPDQSDGPRPVMIVLDTSGSMSESVTTTTTKLQGAQGALAELVRRLPSRTDLGLWSYPATTTGSGSCNPGQSRIDVGPLDRTTTSAQIRALTADGDTPTAEALTAAVDALKADGYHGATLLLVSDGESTCNDPCPVAQQLSAEGFDVTVQALGFQISTQGAEQLRCIANATGGTYHDVTDSTTLLPTLIDAASPDIDLKVTAPDTVPPAATATISATVTNTTPNKAHDVVLTLTLAAQVTDRSALTAPAVLNPVLRLGNIPAGASVTRTWTYSSGLPSTEARTVNWRVIAAGRDVVSTSTSGATTLTGKPLTVAHAGTWLRDLIAAGGRAVILGDSYSSGEGAKTYTQESNRRENRCHRSPDTYGTSLFPVDRPPTNLACSGAVIANLFTDKADEDGEIPQLAKLDTLDFTPDVAFMTMGGNDIGFGPLIAACADPREVANCDQQTVDNPFTDQPAKITLAQRVAAVTRQTEARLVMAYKQISMALNTPERVAARDGRIAQLLILAYPAVLPLTAGRPCGSLEPSEIRFGTQVLLDLNQAVANATTQARKDGYPVHFIAENADAVQPNHTMCDKDNWINPISTATAAVTGVGWGTREKEMVHPNVAGYAAFTQRIIAGSQSGQLLPFAATPTGGLKPWQSGTDPTAVITIDLASTATPVTYDLASGDTAVLHVAGGTPDAPIYLTTYSAPVVIGAYTADETGSLDTTITIPADLPAGQHHLILDSYTADGTAVTAAVTVTISDPLPTPVRLLPLAALLLGLVGITLLAVSGRRRRTCR